MKVKSQIIYSLSVSGSDKITSKYWDRVPYKNNDSYIFKEIVDSIYGNGKNKFKGYKLKDTFKDQLKA